MKKASRQFTLLDVLEILFFYKKMILIVFVLFLAVAGYYALTAQELFRSSMLVRISQREDKVILSEQIRSSEMLRPTRFEFVLDEIQLLTSQSTISEAIRSMKIGDPEQERVEIQYASRHLLASPQNKTTVVMVTFEHPDPEFAARFLDELVKAYLSLNRDIKRKDDIVSYYDIQAGMFQSRVDSLGTLIGNIRSREKLYSYERQQSQMIDMVKRLEDELLEQRIRLQEYENEIEIFRQAESDPYLFSFSPGLFEQSTAVNLDRIKTELYAAERELRAQSKIYTVGHPAYQNVLDIRDRLLERYESEVQGLSRLLSLQRDDLARKHAEKKRRLAEAQVRIEEMEVAENSVQMLEQLRRADQEVLENLLSKRKELQIDSFVDGHNTQATLLSAPSVPLAPFAPNRFRIMTLSGLLGLLLGSLLAFYRRAISPVFTTPADVERILEIPVIATIPLSQSKR